MQTWKTWITSFAILLAVFFGCIGVTYVGDWMQPQTPKWIAVYDDTQSANWCGYGYINGDPCDIFKGPYKDGYLFQIWYDNTTFWHYSDTYELSDVTLFTNGNWQFLVKVKDFK